MRQGLWFLRGSLGIQFPLRKWVFSSRGLDRLVMILAGGSRNIATWVIAFPKMVQALILCWKGPGLVDY